MLSLHLVVVLEEVRLLLIWRFGDLLHARALHSEVEDRGVVSCVPPQGPDIAQLLLDGVLV